MTEAPEKSPDQISTSKREFEPASTASTPPVASPILVATGVTEDPVPSGVVNPKTKFFRGVWAAKSNPNDPD